MMGKLILFIVIAVFLYLIVRYLRSENQPSRVIHTGPTGPPSVDELMADLRRKMDEIGQSATAATEEAKAKLAAYTVELEKLQSLKNKVG